VIRIVKERGLDAGMPREMCYRCFRPKASCLCADIAPMATRTRIVLLMSAKEFKEEKAATGRLTHLCLPNSVIYYGKEFETHTEVRAELADPRNHCVLLYPGKEAVNLTDSEVGNESGQKAKSNDPMEELRRTLERKRLVVFVLDATWGGARKLLRVSPCLQRLPRVMFTPSAPSRYVIKQQPQDGCLSTLEAVHELLLVLERHGLDRYERPEQLLGLFKKMQDYQIACAADPGRPGYRRQPYSDPVARVLSKGRSGKRRRGYLRTISPRTLNSKA